MRLLEAVPRSRRVVIDCDGAYNDPIEFGGDYNHRSRGIEPLLDRRLRQPVGQDLPADATDRGGRTCAPSCSTSTIRPGRRRFDFADKEFSMIYVGHTKFRWRGMSKVLRAIERVRDRVGRVALVGEGWGEPDGLDGVRMHKASYYVDREYLKKVGVEALAGGSLSAGGRDHQQGRLQSGRLSAAVRATWAW